jgi:hypothetical protein
MEQTTQTGETLRALALLGSVAMLASCKPAEPAQPQRIELASAAPDVMTQSPDTSEAFWSVDEDGQSIDFGNAGELPLMSLACQLDDDPPQLAIIRHAAARPGLTALFPVIGNGMRSRFLVDAKLSEGEWRWEGTLPANDPMLDVFTGTRDITATLPGRGMLEIAGSRIPGEFVNWCRTGGLAPQTENEG